MRELQRLNRLFEWSLYAIVLVPFAMILAGGGIGPIMAGIFGVGTVGSHFFQGRNLANESHNRWWNTIILFYLVGAVVELFFTETSVLDAGIRFVLILTLIKLFSRLGERDELQIIALSFLMLSAATTVNEDLTFGILFGVYVIVGTFTLAIFHLRSELRDHPRLALYGTASINRGYVGVLAGISALILSASLTIFFVFPRIGLGFFAQQSRDGVSVTGFSENVELGGHGAIRDNPEVVMRVEFPNGRWPEQELSGLHWRTVTFDFYNGRGWSQTKEKFRRALPWVSRGEWDLTRIHPEGESKDEIQIYLEPLGTNLLPVLWPSESIRLGTTEFVMRWGPRSGHIQRDEYGNVRHTIESEVGIAYRLKVAKNPHTKPTTRPPSEHYLQLPELTPRVRELAAQIVEGKNGPVEKARAIEQHLQSSYGYTTDLPPVGEDPVDSFLFETQRGHCEYFATTMVLLLRENGIPARLVNGFLGGQWNEVGNFLAVRQGDAHAWVEYWNPELGWVPMDPTPAGESLPQMSLLDRGRKYWDAARLTWMKWVIEYDLTAQVEAFRRIASVLQPSGLEQQQNSRVKLDDEEKASDWRTALLVGGLATLLFFAFLRTRRRLRRRDASWKTTITAIGWMAAGAVWMGWFRGFEFLQYASGAAVVGIGVVSAFFQRSRRETAQAPLLTAFERIETAAKREGLARRVDEGPAEFLVRLAEQKPHLKEDLERFRVWYLRARFGGDVPDPDDVDRILAISRRVASGLRRD